jgi:UDP:flavonoid glycosyltransferase YjiC (YdhE family)
MSNSDEEFRHQCEVRHLLKYRHEKGLGAIRQLLSNPAYKKRLAKLQKDMADQWRKGNKGTIEGQWL